MAAVDNLQAVRDYFLYAAAGCGEDLDITLALADRAGQKGYEDLFAPNPAREAVLADLREREAQAHRPYRYRSSSRIQQLYARLNPKPEVEDV